MIIPGVECDAGAIDPPGPDYGLPAAMGRHFIDPGCRRSRWTYAENRDILSGIHAGFRDEYEQSQGGAVNAQESGRTMYSVIIPFFNEEAIARESCRRVADVMASTGSSYELVLVDDGSTDGTSAILENYCRENHAAFLISFSRNFGHQVAISAGFEYARGRAVITIDADLQDPPEVMLKMIEKWKEGYPVVYAKRTERKGETFFKKATAALFYRLLNRMTTVRLPVDIGDFRLVDAKVRDALVKMREKHRYVRGLVAWLGLRHAEVEYAREPRSAGTTKYPLGRMLLFALDAVTSFSVKPLRLAAWAGFCTAFAGFAYFLYVLYLRLFTEKTVEGWSSLISFTLIFNGIILLILGIIGEYIGRIYDELKGRPLYVIERIVSFAEENREEETGRETVD